MKLIEKIVSRVTESLTEIGLKSKVLKGMRGWFK